LLAATKEDRTSRHSPSFQPTYKTPTTRPLDGRVSSASLEILANSPLRTNLTEQGIRRPVKEQAREKRRASRPDHRSFVPSYHARR
jgi:hypothetical protein